MIRDLDLLRIHHAVSGAGRLVRLSQHGVSETQIENIMNKNGLGFAADTAGRVRQSRSLEEQPPDEESGLV